MQELSERALEYAELNRTVVGMMKVHDPATRKIRAAAAVKLIMEEVEKINGLEQVSK